MNICPSLSYLLSTRTRALLVPSSNKWEGLASGRAFGHQTLPFVITYHHRVRSMSSIFLWDMVEEKKEDSHIHLIKKNRIHYGVNGLMICQSTWLFQYIFWGIAFPFVISLYIWLIVFDLSCLVNAVYRFSKVIQLFLAYAAGMLWSENTTSVEELEENIKVYCNSLQGFLLLTYGSMVGAGPTLSTCIRKSANQVSDCSLSLLRKAVSYYGTLSDSLSAQTSLLRNNRAAKWSFSLCTSYLKCWHSQLQSCFFIVLILLFF